MSDNAKKFPKQAVIDVVDNGFKVRLRTSLETFKNIVFRFEDKILLFSELKEYLKNE